ncbi:MAG: hypothetical protein ACR2MA_10780 [Egibacteraceae bacterium]
MPAFICRTCGVQYAESPAPPDVCRICADPRQYIGWEGQRWTTLDELAAEGHRTALRMLEPGLYGIGVEPELAIGQRSLLVVTSEGNVLWDVPGFVDRAALSRVDELGGLAAVSASHPHFYGVMAEWADAFDAPLVLPEADARWLTRPARRVRHYDDRAELVDGVTLVRVGGHFSGSAVLHWRDGAQGRGALLSGDSVTVAQDRAWVSFMWSYPNLIPLDARELDGIAEALDGLAYDRIYGGWWGRVVEHDAQDAVARSVARYRTAITDTRSLEP